MKVSSILYRELGLSHVASSESPRDLYLLIASRFVRLFGFGAIAPILVLFLQEQLAFSDSKTGLFLSLTLFGDVALSLVVSWISDSVGRRRVLAVGSGMMFLSGITFVLSSNYVLLLVSAIFGVISPSGNECGLFSSIEVTIISQLVLPSDRVYVLVWYQILGFVGLAMGSVLSGSFISMLESHGYSALQAYRSIFAFYALIAIAKIALSLSMSSRAELVRYDQVPTDSVEPDADEASEHSDVEVDVEHGASESRPLLDRSTSTPRIATKIPLFDECVDERPAALPMMSLLLTCFLFSMDSFASSLIPASYVSLYFKDVYEASLNVITKALAASALAAVVTSLCAGALAKRAGLVLAMTTFHIPAQILTGAMAFAPTLPAAVTLYIARTCMSSLDSSVRGAFLSAMVPPHLRTRFLGIVDVSRSLAAGPGPFVTGRMVKIDKLPWTFVISGGIKIVADVLLLLGFSTAKLEH
ncbi:hypothetical protein JCM10212_001738 [Sporobolomyces blumeae]